MNGNSGKVVFKPYNQRQQLLFPPSLDSLIPENHLVRLIDSAVEQLDLSAVLASYKGGGTSSYHPKMLLKVLIYSYTQKIYSSRRIAQATKENVNFMWLCAGNSPDFRTINRFRSSKLRDNTEKIFASMLGLLAEANLIKLEEYFLDGTKIEANSNRYTFVWRKSTERYSENLNRKVKELFAEIDQINRSEDKLYKNKDLPELGNDKTPISVQRMKEKVAELDAILESNEGSTDLDKKQKRTLKKASKTLKKDYIPRRGKYDEQLRICGDRKSFSKTDKDATFMRMKEDHMKNGQLKPGYNVQVGCENQFITGYTLHQKPGDSTLLPPHLDSLKNDFGFHPNTVIADAGYGSEENYNVLEGLGIEAVVKYGLYQQEQKRNFFWTKQFTPEGMSYDPYSDTYTCSAGVALEFIGNKKRKTQTGYVTKSRCYQATDCSGCEVKACCHKGQNNRFMQVNAQFLEYRQKARETLASARGKTLMYRRMAEIESVFGQLKQNFGVRRFLLRGISKVTVEFGLLAIAHNMKKWLQAKDTALEI